MMSKADVVVSLFFHRILKVLCECVFIIKPSGGFLHLYLCIAFLHI